MITVISMANEMGDIDRIVYNAEGNCTDDICRADVMSTFFDVIKALGYGCGPLSSDELAVKVEEIIIASMDK